MPEDAPVALVRFVEHQPSNKHCLCAEDWFDKLSNVGVTVQCQYLRDDFGHVPDRVDAAAIADGSTVSALDDRLLDSSS